MRNESTAYESGRQYVEKAGCADSLPYARSTKRARVDENLP